MRSLLVLAALAGCRDKAASPPPPAPFVIEIELAVPGASPADVETQAVRPIETAVNRVAGVTGIEARIEADRATIFVASAHDLDAAMHEVQHALPRMQLPASAGRPTVRIIRRDDVPVLWLAVRGDLIAEVSAFAREEVIERLQRLPGVGRVEPRGLATPTITVRPDPDKLREHGVAMFELVAALQTIVASSPEQLGEAHVREHVRVGDLAQTEIGLERTPEAPMLAVHAHHLANRDDVARAVRAELAKIEPPRGCSIEETKRDPPPRPALVATVQGESLEELRTLADDLVARLAAAGVRDVTVDPPRAQPERRITIKPEVAAAYGIANADVQATLRVLGGQRVGWSEADGERRPVLVKLPDGTLEQHLAALAVRSSRGALVPLSALVTVETGASDVILRVDLRRTTRLSIRGDAAAVKRVLHERPLPQGYTLKAQ